MSEKLDVVGIGNAMVDAIIPSNQSEIEKHEINRDSMNLIDEGLKIIYMIVIQSEKWQVADHLVILCLALHHLVAMEALLEK